jgi:hypothetical protein
MDLKVSKSRRELKPRQVLLVCTAKNWQFSLSGALFQRCQLLDKGNLLVWTAVKENLTNVQEMLLWFWQTKGGLDVRLLCIIIIIPCTRPTKLVVGYLPRKTCWPYTCKKVNLSRKTCQGKLACFLTLSSTRYIGCIKKQLNRYEFALNFAKQLLVSSFLCI